MHKAPEQSQISKIDTQVPSNETARLKCTRSGDLTRRNTTNDATWEKVKNGPPERAQGTWAVTT